MIEVEIHSIRVSLMSNLRVVLLKDIHAEVYLPIFIGTFEADAISMELKDKRLHDRPLPHDLMKNMIETMDAEVDHILINDMRMDIYYARIVLETEDEQREVDSRPSDALALAIRTKAPIFVSEAVMNSSGVSPDEPLDIQDLEADEQQTYSLSQFIDSDEPFPSQIIMDDDRVDETVEEEEFSAFSDFLNTLDLDELDETDD